MVLNTEWSQVEVVNLVDDGNGLGFILAGGRSTGVVIKGLLPGSIAEKDGRLHAGDHLLQIGEVNLRGFSSEQVATVLRQTGVEVRLVVARSVEPSASECQPIINQSLIIQTKHLTDSEELSRKLTYQDQPHARLIQIPDSDLDDFPLPPVPRKLSFSEISALNCETNFFTFTNTDETKTFQVLLKKNVYGLGITVAGYVCEEKELSGIFVKSIVEGSAADISRKVLVNDRIIAVNGQCLNGVTNYQAVEILRNTDIEVNLTLERFLRGRKLDHLQVALNELKNESQPLKSLHVSSSNATLSGIHFTSDADLLLENEGVPFYHEFHLTDASGSNTSLLLESNDKLSNTKLNLKEDKINIKNFYLESNINSSENHDEINAEEKENMARSVPTGKDFEFAWKEICPQSKIIITEINKFSGLGISLEGTVDVECGIEKHSHHYIRSILQDGPVGRQGMLRPGDELLQVNEHKLQGLRHVEVIKILKELPMKVRLICARGPLAPSIINTSQNIEAFESRSLLPGGHQSLQNLLTKAQSERSLFTSSTATLSDQQQSKSLENISGLALWSSDVTTIEIEKNERGFGFSVLDYQDPLNIEGTVIVIRGLIPGGSAEATNEIFPGDRIVSVSDKSIQGLNLEAAVALLKEIPLGITKIGICRPLPNSDSSVASPEDESHSA